MLAQVRVILLSALLARLALSQESPNQNQSDTLVNKKIYLPLQTGDNQTFCPYYVPKGSSQWEWMYMLVYRAFTGQYTPNANTSVYQAQGILNRSAFYRDPVGNTNQVNLLPWFDGSVASANRCNKPAAVKLVEGNGTEWKDGALRIRATPAMKQILSHIAEYMGVILGCDDASFPTYSGRSSMFEAHRFMDLPQVEMHYFIHNIYDSALTSGVSQPDGIIIGTALDNMFNKVCAPSRKIATYQPEGLQNMCLHEGCAKWVLGNATCSPYNVTGAGQQPAPANESQSYSGYDVNCKMQDGGGVSVTVGVSMSGSQSVEVSVLEGAEDNASQ